MKIQKYIMILVLLPLFFGVGYAENNVSVKSSFSYLSPAPEDSVYKNLMTKTWDINYTAVQKVLDSAEFKNYDPKLQLWNAY